MTKQTTDIRINIPVFSGPLDLLLHLIDQNELDIIAISLTKVTVQYLEQVERLRENKVDELIDFLVIGARLLLIKSRALLPHSGPELLRSEEDEDPAEALARQLRRYKRFKEAAAWLAEREALGLRTYLHLAPAPLLEGSLDMSGVTVEGLRYALEAVFLRTQHRDESLSVAIDDRKHTIEGKMGQLRERIKSTSRILFDDLLSDEVGWSEVSVALLAVLELVKRHEVNVFQPVLFGPIEIQASSTVGR